MIHVAPLALRMIATALLTGCAATTGLRPGTEVRVVDNGVVVWVPTGACPYANTAEGYRQLPCRPAVILPSEDERGIDVWQFEMRVKERGPYGIAAGRRPTDVLVAGDKGRCETVRARVAAQGVPTEACEPAGLRVMFTGDASASR
jgi:hypothetical protein